MSARNTRSVRSRSARKLVAYAGVVSTVAMTTEGEAAIVHADLGPQGVVIPSGSFNLDFDLDGLTDFTIVDQRSMRHSSSCFTRTYTSTSTSGPVTWTTRWCRWHGFDYDRLLRVVGVGQNGALSSQGYAANLPVGEAISAVAQHNPDLTLRQIRSSSACGTADPCTGPWRYTYGKFSGGGFLGLTFQFGSSVRNTGWANVVVEDFEGGVRLLGFAYETEPGTPILAGDKGDTPSIAGDSNRDGKIDINDLNSVRNHFGDTGSPGSVPGDVFPFDGVVDIRDLNALRNNFGSGQPSPVPEPPSLLLLAAGAAGFAMLRRRRAKHDQDDVAAAG